MDDLAPVMFGLPVYEMEGLEPDEIMVTEYCIWCGSLLHIRRVLDEAGVKDERAKG
jgi:hypothetical protein